MAVVIKALLAMKAGPAPADYLRLSLEAIGAAAHHLDPQAHDTPSPNFNRHQCELLVQKLSDTWTILTDENAIVSRDQAWWRPALRELYRVLKEAETLIKECCSEPCLKAALRQGDRTQAFAEAFKEVGWCTSVVYIIIRHKKDPSVELEEFPQARVAYREQFMLEKAAKADEQALRLELESWRQKHLCSVEVCGVGQQGDPRCLAAQILERLNAKGVPGDEAPSEASYQSVLWNVDYEVLPENLHLGGGTSGYVYNRTWLGDQYVKKVFKVVAFKLSSFEQEAAALAPIHHPHIVRVVPYSKSEEVPKCCLLMELMLADLCEYMRKRLEGKPKGTSPFALPAAIDLMLQVAEGMRYLHSRKITHRDLKSMNILVNPVSISGFSEEGFVFAKLADFGLAKTKNECTKCSHLTLDVGIRRWMAPEIVKMNADFALLPDAFPMKADVYSFGIVCYEILSGKEPFEGETAFDLYQKLTAPDPLRPQLPSSCPGRLASLIRGCWVGDPRERPAFTAVCKELRYLKGLLMTSITSRPRLCSEWNCFADLDVSVREKKENDQEKFLRNVEMPFRTKMVKTQGPWGFSKGGSYYYDGLSTGIRAFKLGYYSPNALSSFQIEYDLNGKSFKGQRRGTYSVFQEEDTGWIKFNYPDEYLVLVEGSTTILHYGHSGPIVTSLTFTTNQKTYGPYGDVNLETAFRTDYGKVVGFFGRSGDLIDTIGVLISLDEEHA